jgi:anti-anti-sigma factor
VTLLHDGEVDILQVNTPRLSDQAVDALRAAVRETTSARLLLDMERVRFLSSMGIGTMVHIHKVVVAREGRLVLTGLQPSVRQTLQVVKMLAAFRTFPDRASGLADLRRTEE